MTHLSCPLLRSMSRKHHFTCSIQPRCVDETEVLQGLSSSLAALLVCMTAGPVKNPLAYACSTSKQIRSPFCSCILHLGTHKKLSRMQALGSICAGTASCHRMCAASRSGPSGRPAFVAAHVSAQGLSSRSIAPSAPLAASRRVARAGRSAFAVQAKAGRKVCISHHCSFCQCTWMSVMCFVLSEEE